MAKKQGFVPEKVVVPACHGCSQCGDAWEDHLYLRGYDGKHYCKGCFFKIAVKWPRRKPAVVAEREPGMEG